MCRKNQPSALSPQPSALCFRIFSLIFTLTITFFTPNVASADTDACKKIKFGWYFADGEHDAINALSLKLIFPSQLPQHCAALVAAFNAHPTEGSNNIYIPANNRIVTLLETRLRSDGKQGLCAIWTEFPNKPDSKCPSGYGVDQLLPDGFIPRIYPNAETCNGPLLTTEATCGDQLILTLTPAPNQKDPRPLKAEGKDGKSTLELIATVMEGSTPKAGVTVGFGVAVEPNTGGHAHGDLGSSPRPKGKLSKQSGITDTNGEIKLTFFADEPAGLHAVVADCTPAGCGNKATHVVKVKVPDLIHIPPDYGSTPPRYVLVGNVGDASNNYQVFNHKHTHYLTEQSFANLDALIDTFISLGWGQVGINDASLEWGGMFDIDGKWLEGVLRSNGKYTTGGHGEHRDGQQVDISFIRPASVSEDLRQKVYDEACRGKQTGLPRVLWHQNDGYAPHFHLYLTGKGVGGAPKQCKKS